MKRLNNIQHQNLSFIKIFLVGLVSICLFKVGRDLLETPADAEVASHAPAAPSSVGIVVSAAKYLIN